MQSIEDTCVVESFDSEIAKTIKRTWALYESFCTPTTCSVKKVRKCLKKLYKKIKYGLGDDDLCTYVTHIAYLFSYDTNFVCEIPCERILFE